LRWKKWNLEPICTAIENNSQRVFTANKRPQNRSKKAKEGGKKAVRRQKKTEEKKSLRKISNQGDFDTSLIAPIVAPKVASIVEPTTAHTIAHTISPTIAQIKDLTKVPK